MKERKMIAQMMARPSWLWHRDQQFVESVSRQLEEGGRADLSVKQAKTIRDIYKRYQKNQQPHVRVCGSPGNGRRR